jgi:predicted PurR-regulated permease PerM
MASRNPSTLDEREGAARRPAVIGSTRYVAQRALIGGLIVGAVLVGALALWKIRLIVALLFGAIVLASAMRPGIDALRRRGVPVAVGIAIHYTAAVLLAGLLLWLVVPRALGQVQHAIDSLPATKVELKQQAEKSRGLKHDILVGLDRRLRELPSADELVGRSVEITRKAFEVFVAIFFLFASAAYWIYERDRARDLVLTLVPARNRRKVRDTWDLVDLKLGAYVRGQLVLILLVGTVLSAAFWAVGEPYWLLVGPFAGIVELAPVIGPLAAGGAAVGAGLTVSWHVALYAGIVVLVVRLLEDYLLLPRVLGGAVGLSPLVVLAAVAASTILFGPVAVLLAVPIAGVLATVIDVVVLNKDPVKEDTPSVMFPAKEGETVAS